ncbi:hypothetical protein BLNAU_22550 [Blattamonas nauphoetae]|uniref:Uncharacterized protein n=1 Tax=Blattamonas nauphoetae TaxID=2049346 RepID=A0ABQ9WUW0_9EUKA|nr:hypothetical protein BLNAU_22550 [Blattamonas nauphoetae]
MRTRSDSFETHAHARIRCPSSRLILSPFLICPQIITRHKSSPALNVTLVLWLLIALIVIVIIHTKQPLVERALLPLHHSLFVHRSLLRNQLGRHQNFNTRFLTPREEALKLLLEKKQREAHEARTVSKLTPIAENAGEPKGVVKVEHVAPIEGKAKAALSKRMTAAKIVTSNQPSGEAKGANEPAAEEKKESDEKNMETVKKKVTTSKNVHKRHATVVYVD